MGDGKQARRAERDRRTSTASAGGVRQSAEMDVRLGKRAGFSVRVSVTPGGLMAIGGLVSAILLSTAVIVRTARRPEDERPRLPRPM